MRKLILTTALLFLFTLSVSARFSDVSSGHMYYKGIEYVQNEGIVSGYHDGTYRPGNLITRAEFTKVVINARFSDNEINNCIYNHSFVEAYPDVFSNHVFAKYICMAKVKGIIEGYSDGYFRPDDLITLGEASKILAQTFNITGSRSEFRSYAEKLIERRVIPVQLRSLNEYINRGQLAEMVYRIKANVRNGEALKEAALYDEIYTLELREYDSGKAELEGWVMDRLNYSVFKNTFGKLVTLDVDKKAAAAFLKDIEDYDSNDRVQIVIYVKDDKVKFGYVI